jgi:glycosyltransferase involved in cell wall biosynthesis
MHGLAVVGSRMGGIPELVTDGVNGFLYDATNVTKLADCLQRFVDDNQLAARMAERAPRVKSISEDAREWDARYETVVRARSGRAALV